MRQISTPQIVSSLRVPAQGNPEHTVQNFLFEEIRRAVECQQPALRQNRYPVTVLKRLSQIVEDQQKGLS